MKLTLVRHATLLVEVNGRRLLVDPMLGAAGTAPPIENTPNQVPNPLVELPIAAEEVVRGLDGCIVTHLHRDHLDPAAEALLPRELPVLTQPESLAELRSRGLAATADAAGWLGLDIVRTGGRHGTGAIGEAMGPVSGFVIEGLYVAGDTIWCDKVREAIERHTPHTTVVNGGGARFLEGDPITMTADDVRRTRAATDGRVLVCHLEAINHCVERRDAYRGLDGVDVPADGETVDY